jgi:hypothetical protein
MNGYIFLHRQLLEHPMWVQMPAERLKVWICILLRANHKPSKWWDGEREVDIPAGGFITSTEKLAGQAHVTLKQTRGALDYLERAGMVARTRASRYSLVSVLNWDTYQAQGQGEGKHLGKVEGEKRAIRGQGEGSERATDEECKNNKNNKTTHSPFDGVDTPPRPTVSDLTATRKPKKREDAWLTDTRFVEYFERRFWAHYPNRADKRDAMKALWEKYKAAPDADEFFAKVERSLLAQLPRLRASHAQERCKHASTWINGKPWEYDEPMLFSIASGGGYSQPHPSKLMR